MTGSERFPIKLSTNFEKSQQKLIRTHYRKNRAGLVEFVELIETFINNLTINPRPRPPFGHLEPFPKGSSRPGWELWKLEFKMPQLRGAAGQGRLIYLIDTIQNQVILVWVYTHAEFEKRPPTDSLKGELQLILEDSEVWPTTDEGENTETGPNENN